MLLLENNKPEKAISYLERAATADPARTEAQESLAKFALSQGDLTTAVEWLEHARSRKESARILNALAVARKNTAPVSETRDLLQKAVSMDPSYAPAQLNLAAVLDNNRLDPEQAMSHYEAYTRLMADKDDATIAQVRQRMQVMATRKDSGLYAQPDPARREVESLLEKAKTAASNGDPRTALVYCLQANAQASRNQRTDLKERSLRAAATLAPESPRGHFGLGQFLLSQDRSQEALASFQKAHTLAPDWSPLLNDLVSLAVEQRDRRAVKEALNRSEAVENNPDLLLQVADLYGNKVQDQGEARRIYKKWLNQFPNDPRVAEIQAKL
jgi:tetratricopeptide (TPR) repeat protein